MAGRGRRGTVQWRGLKAKNRKKLLKSPKILP